jgi:vacuolar-type H+-ATPase subunit I/STV1|tara:strand:- start:196 stop:564 length:369 start_codon:yes stop_codon:yes gene_type:complete
MFKRARNIFLYSDSEPNEVMIALCHLICLPLTILADFETKNYMLMLLGFISGFYQLWAVLKKDCIKYRLIAVQVATAIAISTVLNLINQGLFYGSKTGWGIILLFAVWNTIRVFLEKIKRYG